MWGLEQQQKILLENTRPFSTFRISMGETKKLNERKKKSTIQSDSGATYGYRHQTNSSWCSYVWVRETLFCMNMELNSKRKTTWDTSAIE